MEAIFIIPAMISPQVNERIVPAIAKMIERNVAITNSALFRAAAMNKYLRPGKTIYDENYIPSNVLKQNNNENILEVCLASGSLDLSKAILESYMVLKEEDDDHDLYVEHELKKKVRRANNKLKKKQQKSKDDDKDVYASPGAQEEKGKMNTQSIEDIEAPKGITFFNMVSLEPTILEIPIEQWNSKYGMRGGEIDDGRSWRKIQIGIKCIPYKVAGVSDVISLMDRTTSAGFIRNWFRRKINTIVKDVLRNIPIFPNKLKRREKGEFLDDNIKMIKYGPSRFDVSSSRTIQNMMSPREPSTWTTMIVLSSYDLDTQNIYDLTRDYRKLANNSWGDMIITNEAKESVFFCTVRTLTCQELSFEYLKTLMNLSNVLDYSDVSRKTTPFSLSKGRTSSFQKAIIESTTDINKRIFNIIKG